MALAEELAPAASRRSASTPPPHGGAERHLNLTSTAATKRLDAGEDEDEDDEENPQKRIDTPEN